MKNEIEQPSYPLLDAMYQEMSFATELDIELAVRRLIDEADLFRFVDSKGRAFRLNLNIALVRSPEDDEGDYFDEVCSSCTEALEGVETGDSPGEPAYICSECGQKGSSSGGSAGDDNE